MLFLFLSALSQDERSLAEALFDAHKDKIYAIAYGILKNRHDAEDAVDEVMMRIIKNLSKFSGVPCHDIKRQIVIYTKSAAIDIYRKNRTRAENETALAFITDDGETEELQLPDAAQDVEGAYIGAVTRERLLLAMQALKPIYRDAIKLRVLFDYSHEEIAVALHISAELARKRCERARTHLQTLLKEENGDA